MNIRAHIFVSGRVQGVFYRAFTKEMAMKHSITGWVKNLSDGRVEAMLEGEKKSIDAVINELRIGPIHADVEKLEVDFEEYGGNLNTFK